MNEPAAILDYASPRPRGRFRLPAHSRLEIARDRDGLTVTETLDAKWGAIGGLIVGIFTLLWLGLMGVGLTRVMIDHDRNTELLLVSFFDLVVIGLWVTEFVVMLMVINNTWRRTILRAMDGELSLEFRAPFGDKRHAWPLDQVIELGIDRTQEPGFVDPRRELTFRAAGGQMVRLFADHNELQLNAIATGIDETMAKYRAAIAPA